MYNLNLYCTCN